MTRLLSKTLTRDSNMELLRIIAMLLVMIVHANFKVIGIPAYEELATEPVETSARFFIGALSIICVNVFVLLSGWYGINFKLEKLGKLIFQVCFFIGLISIAFGAWRDNPVALLREFAQNYWFVTAYVLLFIFAPFLNAFAEQANKTLFKTLLITLFLYQTIVSYIGNSPWYDDGYSPLPFFWLYLLARYLKIYSPKWSSFPKYIDFIIWLGMSLFIAFCSVALLSFQAGGGRMYNYTSPFVIISSVNFFLFFTKCRFRSPVINWLGKSAFAAFLVHMHPLFFDRYYSPLIGGWYRALPLPVAVLAILTYIVLIFLIAVLVDKVQQALFGSLKRV